MWIEAWIEASFCRVFTSLNFDIAIAVRMAVTHAIHEAKDAVGAVYHAAGTTSVFTSQPFERRLRGANTVPQQLQGRLAFFQLIGQHLLGLDPDIRLV